MEILLYLFAAMPCPIGALVGLMLPMVAHQCCSRPAAGIALVLLIFFSWQAAYLHLGGLQLGLSLSCTDFVLVFLAGVAIVCLLVDDVRMPRKLASALAALESDLARQQLLSHGGSDAVRRRFGAAGVTRAYLQKYAKAMHQARLLPNGVAA